MGIGMVENPLCKEEYKMADTDMSDSFPATNDFDVAPEKPESAVNAVYFDFGESK